MFEGKLQNSAFFQVLRGYSDFFLRLAHRRLFQSLSLLQFAAKTIPSPRPKAALLHPQKHFPIPFYKNQGEQLSIHILSLSHLMTPLNGLESGGFFLGLAFFAGLA